MMFYFVAIVPSVDNAAGGKTYATPWDAADSCDFLNEMTLKHSTPVSSRPCPTKQIVCASSRRNFSRPSRPRPRRGPTSPRRGGHSPNTT